MTREEIQRKMDELAREYTRLTTRKSKKRFTDEPVSSVNWTTDGVATLKRPLVVLADALNPAGAKPCARLMFATLDFLRSRATSTWRFDQFSKREEGRWQNVNASLNAVRLAIQQRT